MSKQNTLFAPDWALPPGESILDLVQERGWTQAELSKRLGYTEKHMSQLINGKVTLTVDAAQRLERVLGSSIDFWLALEANYHKHKSRLEAAQRHAAWVPWLDQLPLKDLMRCKAIPEQRLDSKNKPSLVEACLRFFGVATPEEWRMHYGNMQGAFRRSRAERSDVGAISAWLRLGEKQAETFDWHHYDKDRFEEALGRIRCLTSESPDVFGPQMRKLLHEAGVLFILVPAISRAHVSGVARWLNLTRPMIQLSLYGKTNDKFWFSFFHEAAHILLHSKNKKEKKSIFLEDISATGVEIDDGCEREANEWAGNHLIPFNYSQELANLKTKDAVIDFAGRVGIHCGIVVGRLQHDKLIDPSWMNTLKQKFQFKESYVP